MAEAQVIDQHIRATSQGNRLFTLEQPLRNATDFKSAIRYIQLLGRARAVCRVLQLDVRVPKRWRPQDMRDVEELHSLVTTGRYAKLGRHAIKIGSSPYPDAPQDLDQLIQNMERAPQPIRYTFAKQEYVLLDARFDCSDLVTIVSDWRLIGVTASSDGSGRREIQLADASVTLEWPRFQK